MYAKNVKIRLADSKNKPVAGRIIAVCLWSEDPSRRGTERVKRTDENGLVDLSLFYGEWGIRAVSSNTAGEKFDVKTVIISETTHSNKKIEIRSYRIARISGKIKFAGVDEKEEQVSLERARSHKRPIFVEGRANIGTFTRLLREGNFQCFLPNARDLSLNVSVYFPGETYAYFFKLKHPMKKGETSVALPPLEVEKIKGERVSIKGRIQGENRKFLPIIIESRWRKSPLISGHTMSDEKGGFLFYDLPPGDYTLTVQSRGKQGWIQAYSEVLSVSAAKTTAISLNTKRFKKPAG